MATKKKPARKQKPATAKRAPAKSDDYYSGPMEWLSPMLEEAYMKLRPKEDAEAEAEADAMAKPRKRAPAAKTAARKPVFRSVHHEGKGESVLAELPRTHWEDHLRKFRERKSGRRSHPGCLARRDAGRAGPEQLDTARPLRHRPRPDRQSRRDQRPRVGHRHRSRRRADLRCIRQRRRVAVDDGGQSWVSTMDGFDIESRPASPARASSAARSRSIPPTPIASTSEPAKATPTAIFSARIVNALPAYRGIGPIRSDDGGVNWVQETSSPSLSGFSFFKIAVDPADREHCVAATSNGLYERIPSGAGFTWTRRRTQVHTSVVVARAGGANTWFAAQLGGPVVQSADGATWTTAGTGFPAGVGRIALGVQPDNPNVLYALIATTGGGLHSVRRLDGVGRQLAKHSGTPAMLPGSQGDYDLAIAVDPNNANLIYLGGDRVGSVGSIWRCQVSPSGSAFSMTAVSIGENAHADVHVLVHAPGDSNTLWAGTDGGIFVNTNPTGAGTFEARNTGLATLCTNFFAQHPLGAGGAVLRAAGQRNRALHRRGGLAPRAVRRWRILRGQLERSVPRPAEREPQRLSRHRWRTGLRAEPVQPRLLDPGDTAVH